MIDKMEKWFWVWAAFCVLLGLGLLGFIIWVIIKVMIHFKVI
jgi:hypothetical protein